MCTFVFTGANLGGLRGLGIGGGAAASLVWIACEVSEAQGGAAKHDTRADRQTRRGEKVGRYKLRVHMQNRRLHRGADN